jgi:hypothetical protein
VHTAIPKAAGVRSPAVCFAAIGRARRTGLLCAGVAPCILLRNVPGTPWKLSQVPSDEAISTYTGTPAAVPLPARARLFPCASPSKRSAATPKG